MKNEFILNFDVFMFPCIGVMFKLFKYEVNIETRFCKKKKLCPYKSNKINCNVSDRVQFNGYAYNETILNFQRFILKIFGKPKF